MSKFKYNADEMEINKVLKRNLEVSKELLDDSKEDVDDNIAKSLSLLNSLGKKEASEKLSQEINSKKKNRPITNKPKLDTWKDIVTQANEHNPEPIILEDILSSEELEASFQELDEINNKFSNKTSITNRNDLAFLGVATALQVAKVLLFPYVSKQFNYGESFNPSTRLDHNDPTIEKRQRDNNDRFRDKNVEKYGTGKWIEILYQSPAYDITKGSKDLGINMGGKYHRMYTLGHDPILGWIFGTMNILTDIVTLNNFTSYRVARHPMVITPERVPIGSMIRESYEYAKAHPLNLPSAIFAQAQHLKSDEFTKLGLPVPLLSSLNEEFSSKLYTNNYDALCAVRDLKIVGASFIVTKIMDIIIALVHGLFRSENEPKNLYEVRTRKILLLSNSIASSSTIINAGITKNPQNLDIGSLLNTVTRLFIDIRFITKIKQEFIENEISNRTIVEINKIDKLYDNF